MRLAWIVGLSLLTLVSGAIAQSGSSGGAAETRVGGGVYLSHYLPVSLTEAEAESEIYTAFLDVDHESGAWAFHVETRWRDTRLREFYPSTIWLQEAWAAYRAPVGDGGEKDGSPGEGGGSGNPDAVGPANLTLRAGKLYSRLGRFWDGSFFGNVHYFDGLKLDPDFGAEAVLNLPLAAATVELRGQYLTNGDRINGALAGRDLEGLPAGSEGATPVAALHVEAPLLGPAETGGEDRLRLRAGLSGMIERGTLEGSGAAESARSTRDVELNHLAADVELRGWGHVAYAEYIDRTSSDVPDDLAATPAGSSAGYWPGRRPDTG